MEAQIQYLDGSINHLTERDKALFSRVVEVYSKHEIQRANMYAKELAELRKTVTEQKMKEKFPELPALKAPEEQAGELEYANYR